jgi:choline dehydrogenase-like flavoprotein
MIIDTYQLSKDHLIESDVCIVGAGLAGMTLAKEFIDSKFSITLLEGGGNQPDKNTQLLQWGENIGHPYFSLDTARPRYLGGSVNRWFLKAAEDTFTAQMRPLDEIDFQKRDWVSDSGWPIEKSDLIPFYERAQILCGIEPPTYRVSDWENHNQRKCLPFDHNLIRTVIFKFTKKTDFLQNHLKDIISAHNIKTFLNANVTEIRTDKYTNRIRRLKVKNLSGQAFWAKAKIYILSAGAIEIARLLLASNRDCISGVGNEHDLVGRYFMEHPHCTLGLTVPRDEAIFNRTTFYNRAQAVNKTPIVAKLSLTADALRDNRLLNQVIDLSPRIIPQSELQRYPLVDTIGVNAAKSIRKHGFKSPEFKYHLLNAAKDLDSIFLHFYRLNKAKLYSNIIKKNIKTFHLLSVSEQVPNPNSRVLLSHEKDQLNMPRVNLDWRMTSQDMDSIHDTMKLMALEFDRLGFGKINIRIYNRLPNEGIRGGWHHLGTTRMHDNPKKGVVDANSKLHGHDNIYIAGPSVFPTGGYANPSLTVVALAIRLASHLKAILNQRLIS